MPPTAPKIVGVVNITTDSFSDGGRYLQADAAIAHGRALVAAGADILDLGAASSHPDATDVTPDTEIARLAPVLAGLADLDVPLSVDSFHSTVQSFALTHGASLLNDIQGFSDPPFYPTLAASDAHLIVMHSIQAKGKANREDAAPEVIWDRMFAFFDDRLAALEGAGIARDRLILDPGMGFFLGRRTETTLAVLARMDDLKTRYGLPVLVGVSRKSFLRSLTGKTLDQIGPASLAAELFAVAHGADYIRTHDVGALRDGLRVTTALNQHRSQTHGR